MSAEPSLPTDPNSAADPGLATGVSLSASRDGKRRPQLPLVVSVLPLLVLLVAVTVGGSTLGLDNALLIASMLLAATVGGAIAVTVGGSWDDIQHAMGSRLTDALPVVLILLAIGMLIGCWMLSGTIPLLVVIGIELVDPQYMVLTAFLVTSIMSIASGTSWGSAGTLGVALMGTAAATGAPLAATAGAVVSGAYLGDKISPLSDSTNICALGAGADLYKHIRHMLWTAVPSGLLAFVVYALAGSRLDSDPTATSGAALSAELRGLFELGWWPVLPILVVIIGVALRKPPTLTLVASAVAALIVGTTVQRFGIGEAIGATVNGFDLGMLPSAQMGTLSAEATNLLVRGGILSMAPLIVLLLAAFLMAATLTVSGAFDTLLRALVGSVRSAFGLIIATLTAGITLIAATSQGTVVALVVGDLFRDAYKRRKLAPENLSRSLEDSVTIVEPLLPWTVSAIYMATTLGVPTLSYLPWAVFCYGGPFFSALIAFTYPRTGRGIRRLPKE